MNKMLFAAVVMAAFLLLSSSSCDETNSPTDNSTSYLPISIGNWWYYQYYLLDVEGELSEITGSDTITVTEKVQFEGRSAYKVHSTGEETDSYMISENNKVEFYMPEMDMGGLMIEPGWITILDVQKNKWDIFNMNIDQEFYGYKYKGTLKSTGNLIGSGKIDYKGKEYNSKVVYVITEGNFNTKDSEGNEENIVSADTTEYIFAQGVGLISVTEFDNEEEESYGNTQILIDNKIK